MSEAVNVPAMTIVGRRTAALLGREGESYGRQESATQVKEDGQTWFCRYGTRAGAENESIAGEWKSSYQGVHIYCLGGGSRDVEFGGD
jgi:hypothetical protein